MVLTTKQAKTVKQRAWVSFMLQGKNPTESARLAEYKGDHKHAGWKNTTKPHLMTEIDRKRAELSTKIGVTVAGQVVEHRRLATKAENKGDIATATRNLELVGKTIAAYADKNINIGEQTVIIIAPKAPQLPQDGRKRVEADIISEQAHG